MSLKTEKEKEIKSALEIINARSNAATKFYKYYNGDHIWNFSSKKFKDKYGQRLQTLRENLCRTVVKAPVSRLEIINFLADRADTENPAWRLWKKSNMPHYAGKVHREAFRTGAAFVIVWTDKNGRARITPQFASNIAVWRDEETGETIKAAKRWTANKETFLTIYYPDRIEKYISEGADSSNFGQRKIDGESFPLPNPFNRVPVFGFTFDDDIDGRGVSILTDVIPLNDALNKSYADIFVGQEYNSMRARHVAGLRAETDAETGKPIPPFESDDATWISEDGEVRFGEFSDANLSQMVEVKREVVKDIALVSGIPPSYFNLDSTGTAISGEALRKIEARFTNIVQEAQRSFGESWNEVISFALEIDNENKIEKNLEIEVQWTDASPVSESEMLDNAMKKINLGWSVEQVQRDYGLSDEQIETMRAEISERDKTKVENAAKFFDSGNEIIP